MAQSTHISTKYPLFYLLFAHEIQLQVDKLLDNGQTTSPEDLQCVTNFNNTFESPTTKLESTFESPRNITRIITIGNLLESSLSDEFKSFFTTPKSRKGITKSSMGRSLHYHEQDWWSDLLYSGKWQPQDEGSGTIYTSRLVEQTSSSDCLLWV